MTSKQKKSEQKSERGASLVEYALLVALISIIALASIRAFGLSLSESFSEVASTIEGAQE